MSKTILKAKNGLKGYGQRSFSSLLVKNYRLYFIGQGISLSGTWLQSVAQTWLILQLTHSGTLLGFLVAAQTLPVLFFAPMGGLIADRVNKRRLLYVTQSIAMTLALILGILVLTHSVHAWMVFVLAALLGCVNSVDNPTRQTFIIEMVGKDNLTNAVSLNSTEVNLARVIGPSIAAILIAGIGIGWCFLVNAVSYLAVLFCLFRMNKHELKPHIPVARAKGQLKAGLKYVWHTPVLRNVLIMMALVGTFTYEFQVVLPLFATRSFHGNASTYALLLSAMGIGSFIGGVFVAGRGKPSAKRLLTNTLLFAASMLLVAISPDFILALLLMFVVGFCSIGFSSLVNSTLQLNSSSEMRGRVMSLWTVAFLGSTPIGGPIIGLISTKTSPRLGLATGGFAALVAAIFSLFTVHFYRRKQAEAEELEYANQLDK